MLTSISLHLSWIDTPMQQTIITSTQYNQTQQADIARSNAITTSLIILLPIFAACAIVSLRQYQARIRRQQIKCLNRIWQLDCGKKLS